MSAEQKQMVVVEPGRQLVPIASIKPKRELENVVIPVGTTLLVGGIACMIGCIAVGAAHILPALPYGDLVIGNLLGALAGGFSAERARGRLEAKNNIAWGLMQIQAQNLLTEAVEQGKAVPGLQISMTAKDGSSKIMRIEKVKKISTASADISSAETLFKAKTEFTATLYDIVAAPEGGYKLGRYVTEIFHTQQHPDLPKIAAEDAGIGRLPLTVSHVIVMGQGQNVTITLPASSRPARQLVPPPVVRGSELA